ncbi:unnamed protein product [Eruca vesicaria subsp. sativa]|uniref:F-box domain-containing protein n=1 Tax=Eruca vesicaria subsp. sativa TaxID=29727 RepID=A0ABC8JHW4_ERUVS|nr:unnamed protein product [Eruca vesicaria subsp. sativa]
MQRVRVSSERAAVHKLGDSQMTLSPKFRVAASVQSPLFDPSSEQELSLNGEPLIPGLPDDVALSCLLRVPVESHVSSRSVCKRWHLLFCAKETFFARRKELECMWLVGIFILRLGVFGGRREREREREREMNLFGLESIFQSRPHFKIDVKFDMRTIILSPL